MTTIPALNCMDLFQSTPSARRATDSSIVDAKAVSEFQSTPSARRATVRLSVLRAAFPDFNPRPPRGERPVSVDRDRISLIISIHALREESDQVQCCWLLSCNYFNPRPPRGERLPCHRWRFRGSPISIHALREESDARAALIVSSVCNFNPRPPRGERPSARRGSKRRWTFQSTPSARRATLTKGGRP